MASETPSILLDVVHGARASAYVEYGSTSLVATLDDPFPSADAAEIRLSVRRSCFISGHTSVHDDDAEDEATAAFVRQALSVTFLPEKALAAVHPVVVTVLSADDRLPAAAAVAASLVLASGGVELADVLGAAIARTPARGVGAVDATTIVAFAARVGCIAAIEHAGVVDPDAFRSVVDGVVAEAAAVHAHVAACLEGALAA